MIFSWTDKGRKSGANISRKRVKAGTEKRSMSK
jgi:hypothetical protein